MAFVAARRSTWTVWNVRAEVERLLRTDVPSLPAERHRELADTITALAVSPACSVSLEAPAMLDEPTELRRADGESVFTEHAATRYTSQAVLDADHRLLNATRTPTADGLAGASVSAALHGFEAVTGTRLDAGQRQLDCFPVACASRGISPAHKGATAPVPPTGCCWPSTMTR